ncbi:MAG TPA: hypothetical protein VGR37_19535 [Longimicrobiaceae bacterium]|nr:hypothetical protein [Longimicrobiaceae bacterium]
MYSTCLYCRAGLGTNESVEAFQVGRRLAFDSANGRLWVVCLRCGRWNLSPLEERWEAIEQCERHFGSTRRQVSTGNVGLARVGDGLDLVRIGKPLRPEFAAWRYGDQLLRRRRRHQVEGWAGAGIFLGFFVGAVPLAWPVMLSLAGYDLYRNRSVVVRATTGSGDVLPMSRAQVRALRLLPSDGPEGWLLRVAHHGGTTELSGSEAFRMAGLALPHLNQKGAAPSQVNAAVEEIERAGGPQAYFRTAAHRLEKERNDGIWVDHDYRIGKALTELRLALEMAAHEEAEHRALEGELHLLERAWKEAEEIASIADALLIPVSVREKLQRLRGGRAPASDDDAAEAGTAGPS